jgi:hypothetical protein
VSEVPWSKLEKLLYCLHQPVRFHLCIFGQFTLTTPYEGECAADGKKHGQGEYFFADGSDRYKKGEWHDGKTHGQGGYFYAATGSRIN